MTEKELIELFLIEQHKQAQREIMLDDLVEPIEEAIKRELKGEKPIWQPR